VSVAAVYEGWPRVQAHLVKRIPELGPDELALKSSQDGWPIWAIAGHIAGTRAYWLCSVCQEPGVETTPFTDPANDGWEDHLDRPRGAVELLAALESTWRIVESCLELWTPEMLGESFSRQRNGETEHHSRQSVLTRLVMHDSFHSGEISLLLGARGLESTDPWAPL
jgi:uncharacterized damage-inducible protein DinB